MLDHRKLCGLLALLLVAPEVAQGQTTFGPSEALSFNRPESWALKYFSSATLFVGFGPPAETKLGEVHLAIELGTMPTLSASQRTVGFDGTHAEDLNKIPVLVRPRLSLGLPGELTLTVAYIPPIQINGAKANLFSAALGRPLLIRGPFRVGLQAYGQVGSVEGDFTCSAQDVAGGSSPIANPFGCSARSSDEVLLRYFGLELGAAYRIESAWDLEPHLSIAGTYMDPVFQVHAQYSGVVDQSRLSTQGVTVATTGGFALPLGPSLSVAAEAFYSPLGIQGPVGPFRVDGLLDARALIDCRF